MADLRVPLLFERREAEVIIDVTDGGAEANGAVNRSPVSDRVEVPENPFEFIGSDFLPLQLNRFVDPFRNHMLSIGGAYELFKILVMVPFTLIRLVIFVLSLLVGFIATKISLYGWKYLSTSTGIFSRHTEVKIVVQECRYAALHDDNMTFRSISVDGDATDFDGDATDFEYTPHYLLVEDKERWCSISYSYSAAGVARSAYISFLDKEMLVSLLIACDKSAKLVNNQHCQENGGSSKLNEEQTVIQSTRENSSSKLKREIPPVHGFPSFLYASHATTPTCSLQQNSITSIK